VWDGLEGLPVDLSPQAVKAVIVINNTIALKPDKNFFIITPFTPHSAANLIEQEPAVPKIMVLLT